MLITKKPQVMTLNKASFHYLIGDVGGTNARFALVRGDQQPLEHELTLPTAKFENLATALQEYLQRVGSPEVHRACIAIANPITGDWLRMTNSHWSFSVEQTRLQLGFTQLRVLNDWEAMAMSGPVLTSADLVQIGPGDPQEGAPKGFIGPGTGLGVASLVRSQDGQWVACAGEGGHVTLAPTCKREIEILGVLLNTYSHVSVERVVSGMGLENIYKAICELEGLEAEPLTAADITTRALKADDILCEESLDRMCRFLGAAAGNLALTLGALGGVYLGGGIVGKLGDYFRYSGFREAFESKGRFKSYMQGIPTYVIRANQPALLGAAMGLGLRVRH